METPLTSYRCRCETETSRAGRPMAARLVPDSPAVMVALEHLKELDEQLREDGAPFAPEARLHLARISAAIAELEADRRAAHEHLEVESIENSKLRRHINGMRERMSREIVADVAAARASNAEELEELQKDLGAASQLLEEAVKRQQALCVQSEALSRERQQVKAEHENVIAALNYQIDLKYSLQTRLDQTREQVEELRSRVAAAQQDQVTLAQKVEMEMQASQCQKDSLCEEVHQTKVNIQQQKQAIKMSRKEVQRLDGKKRETQDQLEELTTQTSEQERHTQRLTASRCQCEQQLDGEARKHQEMRRQRHTLKEEFGELGKAFSLTIQQLKEEIATVEGKIEEGRAARLLLVGRLAQIYELYKRQHSEEDEVRIEHLHVSQRLMRSKLQLEESVASIVKHSKEIKEMDKQTGELQEANVINKRVFDSNQEELCSNVDVEKKNVIQYEEEESRLRRLLEEAKKKQEEHVAKMSSDISSARRRYVELQREEAALEQRQPRSTDPDWLTRHVAQSEAMYRQVESQQHQEMEQCTAETESFTRSSQEKQKEVEEKEEMLKEVEAEMNEKHSRYKRLTALTSELSSRRSQLELSIQGLREETSSLLRPKEEMKAELEASRASYMDMLDQRASELRAVEMDIYNNGVRLEQVSVENSRLHLRIGQMTEDVSRARQDQERYWQEIHRLREDTKALLESLREAWTRDLLVTEECQSRSGAVLVSMGALLSHLEARRQQLGDVSSLLHQHMLEFSKRLGDITTLDQHS